MSLHLSPVWQQLIFAHQIWPQFNIKVTLMQNFHLLTTA